MPGCTRHRRESPRQKKTISRPDSTKPPPGGAELFRCRFARYSHCKIIILKKNGAAFRVLTGSTNFAITGLCVNANHVLVFDRPGVAGYYSDVFNKVWQVGKAGPFRSTDFSNNTKKFTVAGFPHTEVNFSRTPRNAHPRSSTRLRRKYRSLQQKASSSP